MFSAARNSFLVRRLTLAELRQDALAGISVGIIALPLSMALAIAVGVPPQHGLYTAIVGGMLIALAGGSRVNISGPTAAFVVILLPVTAQFGIGGLLLAGMLAGLILIAMGLAGFGSLIAVVPYPVTIGFTAGIGTVIAALQLRDLLGLRLAEHGPQFLDYLGAVAAALDTVQPTELLVGASTLLAVLLWQRRRSRLPSHLFGLAVGIILAWLLAAIDPANQVATIGSRFDYLIDGVRGQGIPPLPPHWLLPWQLADASGAPIGFSFELLKSLLPSALAIAMLGALESLLCATVADGMTGERHDPNDELIGQGVGNLLVPFFGGIPATAALARTAANIRAGGRSPLAAVVHGLFLLLALLVMAPLLTWVPMASLAALLLVVGWNMSEVQHFRRVLRVAPRGDALTLLACYSLTVLVNMEVAIAVGMSLAALIFIRRTIELTGSRIVERHAHAHTASLPDSVLIYDVNGPLFFGAAQKALNGLARLRGEVRAVILDLSDVTMMDMTAIVALESIIADMRSREIMLIVNGLAPAMILKLRHAGLRKRIGRLEFARSIEDAADLVRRRLSAPPPSLAGDAHH